MPGFKVVLIEHGYASTDCERRIVTEAGGEFVDAENLPLGEALELCREADAILFRRLDMPADLIQTFRRCKIILRYGIGTDNVDLAAATEAGIIVGHVPAYCLDEVSAHAVGLLLACSREIVRTHQRMREQGAWDVHRQLPILRMAGRTFGLVGFGKIGQAMAKKLSPWNLRLLASDPFVAPDRASALGVELVDFETLCREADYISLHCPLLPETRHLVNARALSRMKPNAIVINTARGPVVDSEALIVALDAGKIAMAGLDVFEEEPLPATSPLRRHAKVITTDHTAWYSEESQVELQKTAAEEVVRVCLGSLPHSLANPEVLSRLGRFSEWTPSESAQWQLKRLAKLSA